MLELNKNKVPYDLIDRLKNDDMVAFDQIYDSFMHKLFSFVFNILKVDNPDYLPEN
jgi:hypothetical protein